MVEYNTHGKIAITDVIHNHSKPVITFKQVNQYQECEYFTQRHK